MSFTKYIKIFCFKVQQTDRNKKKLQNICYKIIKVFGQIKAKRKIFEYFLFENDRAKVLFHLIFDLNIKES